MLKEATKMSPLVKWGGWFVLLTMIIGVMAWGGGNTPASSITQTVVTIFETRCLSSWDWSFKAIFPWFKDNLKDPSSFEHVKTTYTDEKDGTHIIRMQYRAKNGFGALDLWWVQFKSNDNCEIIGSIEPIK
jgi:hypothetical protein